MPLFEDERPIIAQVFTSPSQALTYSAAAEIVNTGTKFRFMLTTDLGTLMSKRRFGSAQAAAFHSHRNVIKFYTPDAHQQKLNRG